MTSKATGNCYDAALKYMQDHADDPDDLRLVHGNVATLRQDEDVNHAWIEEENAVYEVANGRNKLLLKDSYYKELGVTNVRRYTLLEAVTLALKHGRSGPLP